MHCSQIEKLFKYYVNGGLDEEHSYVIRRHLKKCSSCRGKVRRIQINKIIPKAFLVIALVSITLFLIVRSTNKIELPFGTFGTGAKKVISNIIIEIFSRDSGGDLKIIKDFTDNFGGEIISENPLSIKLVKQGVNEFIADLSKILVFPEDTPEKVKAFVSPLGESDEVCVKIKFLKKEG
ncbi:MAG: zf-HC2 domain-containing protein [Candidatus Omnitrophica bacterium]|nr:zf-HC2 domain-containing protein [Candidatus Omnitrophota bacterium]